MELMGKFTNLGPWLRVDDAANDIISSSIQGVGGIVILNPLFRQPALYGSRGEPSTA